MINFLSSTSIINIRLYNMLGFVPIKDLFEVLKYMDEIKEYDRSISDDIYYGNLHGSINENYIDEYFENDSNDTQYDEYSIGNYSNDGYYFLTESY